jgi:hypothetical protein
MTGEFMDVKKSKKKIKGIRRKRVKRSAREARAILFTSAGRFSCQHPVRATAARALKPRSRWPRKRKAPVG